MTWTVHYAQISPHMTGAVRRRLLLELRRCGVSAEDIAVFSSSTWWPTLRQEPEILVIQDMLDRRFCGALEEYIWAEPQILIRLPDEDGTEMGEPHTDELPPWIDPSEGWVYRSIFGVELTDSRSGCTVIHTETEKVTVYLNAGDVLEFSGDQLHSGSPNLGSSMRMALFFRLLTRT